MNPTVLLFGFDFLSPGLFAWLAAAAAPLLIHLWSRRRYQEMRWAAMQYLLAAMKAARRRTRLEQWLLLLIRTAIIVTLVLAAMEPYLELGSVPFVPGVRTHRVFLIDGSYSMGYRPGQASRFETATQLAAQVVEESNQGDGFSLVLISDPARPMVAEPSFAPRDFLAELEALRLPHTGSDLAGAATHVERLLQVTERKHPKLSRQEVYVLTDLGRNGWDSDALGRKTTELIRRRFRQVAELAPVTIIDLGQEVADNLAITDARTTPAFVTPGHSVDVRAELRNHSRSATTQSVQLLADGRRVAQEQVRLDPGGRATVGFAHRFDLAGDHTLEIVAPGDRLDIDNHRWIALSVKPALRVLCVDGQPTGALGAASDFLVFALSPDRTDRGATIQPEVVGESALVERDLHQYDCVFLVNVAQFTSSEARLLDAYVQSGGGLVIFLGDRVLPARYNRALGGETPKSVDLMPAQLPDGPVEGRRLLDPLDYRHPIVEVFRGQERAGLLTTPVQQYFPLEIPEESAARVVLALDDGSPLVVERPVGSGRVILVGTSADVSWTAMPVLPSYVPVIQEILAFAVTDQYERHNVLVGEGIGATLTRVGGNTSVTVQTPDARSETIPLSLDGGAGSWQFNATDPSGIYAAAPVESPEAVESFAVNPDADESDLAKISESELRQGVLSDVAFELHSDWQRMAAQPQGMTTRPSSLAKTLLYLLLGLLLVETYLARRFGHHT